MVRTPLDSESGVPFYRQIKAILRQEIEDGALSAEQPITEARLMERFGLSRAPVRQALSELTHEGFVYRKQGKGTFPVPGVRVEFPAAATPRGLFNYLEDEGMAPTTTVHSLSKLTPPDHVREALALEADAEVLHFVRINSVDDQPVDEITIYIRVPDGFEPTQQELEDVGTAFKLLQAQFGVSVERAENAVSATAASAAQAKTLEVEAGSPLLKIESVLYYTGGVPGAWRSILHRADQFKYRFTSPS